MTKPVRCDLWYIGLWLSTSIGIYRVLLHPCEKCHTIKRKQTLNSMVENHVKMTPLTQRKARYFTCLFKTIACPRTQFKHPLRWYCIAKNGIYIHDWNSGATNDPKSFVISHELSTKIALERVGGICPSHFSISTISHYASLQQRNNAQRIHLGSPDQNKNRKCTNCNKMDLTKRPSLENNKTATTSLSWRNLLWLTS